MPDVSSREMQHPNKVINFPFYRSAPVKKLFFLPLEQLSL